MTSRFFTRALTSTLALLALGACGDDGGEDGAANDPDAANLPDPIDAEPAPVCDNLPESFGALGELQGTAIIEPIDELEPDGPRRLALEFDLDQGSAPDRLFVELWEDVAPFDANGFEARSVGLTGIHSDLITCGACVFIGADVTDPNQLNFHMARGGSLDISTLTLDGQADRIEGSISGLVVREVDISQDGQVEVVAGCVSELESMSFALDVVPATTSRRFEPRERLRQGHRSTLVVR